MTTRWRQQRMMEALLVRTGASRTTLRLESEDGGFPVVAEAVAHGVDQYRWSPAITDLRAAPTVRYLAERKTVLIQEDLAAADPPVPEVLLSLYKAKAQMLAPVIHDQQLIGIISVHDVRGPRKWSDADADHLHDAQQQISAGIDHDEGSGGLGVGSEERGDTGGARHAPGGTRGPAVHGASGCVRRLRLPGHVRDS